MFLAVTETNLVEETQLRTMQLRSLNLATRIDIACDLDLPVFGLVWSTTESKFCFMEKSDIWYLLSSVVENERQWNIKVY